MNRGFASKESRLAAVEKKESELAKLEKIVQVTFLLISLSFILSHHLHLSLQNICSEMLPV